MNDRFKIQKSQRKEIGMIVGMIMATLRVGMAPNLVGRIAVMKTKKNAPDPFFLMLPLVGSGLPS